MKKELSELDIISNHNDLIALRRKLQCVMSIIDIANNEIDAFEVIDVPAIKVQIDKAFREILIIHRYVRLRKAFDDKLTYSTDSFYIDGHKFSTLDEVEKAWKNKAFL